MSGSKPVRGGENVPPIYPKESVAKAAIGRLKKLSPSLIPLITIQFPSREEFYKHAKETFIPVVMRLKALSIFLVKNLELEGMIAGTRSLGATTGGLFVGIDFPLALLNTYALAKNWKKMGAKMRTKMSAMILSNSLLSSAGAAMLAANVPLFAKKLGMAHSMQAMKIGATLGPIGVGVAAVVALGETGLSTRDAIKSELQMREVAGLIRSKGKLATDLIDREKGRFSAKRDFAVVKAFKFFLLAAGLGLGAIGMGAALVAMAMTPILWAAIGAVGLSLVIGIAVFAYRKIRSQKKEEQEALGIAKSLAERVKLHEDIVGKIETIKIKSLTNEIYPLVKNILINELEGESDNIKNYFTDQKLEDLLNASGWPGNPPLIEIIAKQIQAGNYDRTQFEGA